MDSIKSFLEVCHMLHEMRFVSGSGGNISMKVDDRFVITPTGRPLGALKENDLVWINQDGSFSNGKPSKETRMHRAAYEAREDITAVIHVHALYSVAIACLKDVDKTDAMPHYTPGYDVRVGKLPIIDYFLPGSQELADSVTDVLKVRNSVLLANHGLVTCGSCLETAYNLVEEIEENAQLYFILGENGKSLTADQATLLR